VFSRRPFERQNRGRVAAAAPGSPLTILGAASVLQWCRSDLGITIGTGVSAWADQSGNGRHYTQGTGAAQASYNATGGPNGRPSLLFDGTDDFLEAAAFNLPAPGTTPTYLAIVFRIVSWTSNDRLFGDAATVGVRHGAFMAGASPEIRGQNTFTAIANTGAAVGTYVRGEFYFSNTASDYVRCANTNVTGSNMGNGTSTGRRLGTDGAGPAGVCANIEVCEILYRNADLTAGERTALNAYWTATYGLVSL
jgi:hypothetical protein